MGMIMHMMKQKDQDILIIKEKSYDNDQEQLNEI